MNPLQRAAWIRKGSYLTAIVALFVVSMFWRGGGSFALGNTNRVGAPPTALHKAADSVGQYAIEPQAVNLDLREFDQGDPELAGEVMRLGLTGARGFMTAYLWRELQEKQKRGELADMEMLVRLTTKLQPHFLSPWLFQSWNIAYNVSVDQHRLGDMYFYIARGIDLLAEGERRNKRSPDMRYEIAFYYQNKFGVTDKKQTLRSLFALSCIPPGQRSADTFRNPDGTIDMAAFRKFCEEYPHLVRRLKEKLNCRTPLEVVAFLEENRSVPSRFKNDAGDYAVAEEQFPVLPPQFNEGPDEWKPTDSGPDDDKSGYRAARAWYAYSLLLIPPSPKWTDGQPISVPAPRPGPPGNPAWDQYDPVQYRMPRRPMLILFRQGAPRAQSYQAEFEVSEGWFDNTGWRPDEGVDETNRWFPRTPNETYAVFGANRSWAAEQWSEAYRRWKEHGEANGLVIEPGRFQAIREAAGGDVGSLPQRPTDTELRDDAAVRRRYAARLGLFYYERNRTVTNFPFFLMNAEAEMQPPAMAARKALWNAELARTSGNTNQAIRRYAEAFELWKTWLSQYEAYSRNDALQEEMFEAEYRYVRLLTQDDPQVRNLARARYENLMRAVIPGLPSVPPADERIMSTIRQQIAEREISPFGKPKPNGEPWISDQAKENVRIRLGSTTKLTASDDTK